MEKVCYIYSILNPTAKTDKTSKYSKKVNRELYRLNAGILDNESNEYKEYSNNQNNYYPENISDISPSALLSLSVFISLLKKENITNIKGVPYLPIRFLARDIAAEKKQDKQLYERNIKLQRNITDKFIRTFRRASFHFSDFNIESLPYEYSEFIEMKLSNTDCIINNDILKDVYNSTLNQLENNINKRI